MQVPVGHKVVSQLGAFKVGAELQTGAKEMPLFLKFSQIIGLIASFSLLAGRRGPALTEMPHMAGFRAEGSHLPHLVGLLAKVTVGCIAVKGFKAMYASESL